MVKCKYCGEMNLEDSKYCARCGQELPSSDNTAMKDTLAKAQKSFDKDSLATLERSRITYVCTVCGNINSIEQDRCDSCGKPRPRSEYVAALRKLKQSGRIQPEAQKQDSQIPQINEEQPAMEEEQVEQPQSQANYAQGVGGQLPAAVQPFVVVPYVNAQQPLWQYTPNQVYRFQPYTQEEIDAMKEQQAAADAAAHPASEENSQKEEVKTDRLIGTKHVRVTALLSLLVALATIVCMYLVPYTKTTHSDPAIFYLSGIVNCLSANGLVLTDKTLSYSYLGWYSFVAPVLLIVALILLVVLIVRALIRLVTGKASVKGWILPLFIFLTLAGALVGIIEQVSGLSNGVEQYFRDANIGTYLIPILALVLLFVSFFNKANIEKKRKNRKTKSKN